MLIVHKVLDALYGRGKRYTLHPTIGMPDRAHLIKHARLIDAAQKFDFGLLPFELLNSDTGSWRIIEMSPDERTAWCAGLLPLPFPICWYEFTLGKYPSALLVMEPEDSQSLFAQRFDLYGEEVGCDGIIVRIDRDTFTDEKLDVACTGNIRLLEYLEQMGKLQEQVASNAPLAIYLTLMLHSRSTEMSDAPPPPKFWNRQRVKKGLTPLPAHRIVHIVPHHYRKQAEAEAAAERRLPRLHWRRSHLRHFDHQTGNSKYSPTAMWNGKQGWWVTIVPRMLVGKAEMGSVSHEYKLDQPKAPYETAAAA